MTPRHLILATSLALIAADYLSTALALQAGHVEGNPLAKPFVNNPLAHVAIRIAEAAAVTLYTKYARTAPIGLTVANTAMAIAVASNTLALGVPMAGLVVLAGVLASTAVAAAHMRRA